MEKKPTKMTMVKSYLIGKGSITSLEAIKNFSATRLADMIYKLKNKGWVFNKVDVELKDDAGYTETYTKYILVSRPKN